VDVRARDVPDERGERDEGHDEMDAVASDVQLEVAGKGVSFMHWGEHGSGLMQGVKWDWRKVRDGRC
jgi:hypothetical protein